MGAVELRSLRPWLAVGSVVLAACGDATGPGREPEIINTTDNFQYQISDVRDFTGTQVYTWQNTGTTATVNQSAAVAAGSVTLVLRDAAGMEVHNRSLAENGTFSSSAGTPGQWTVRVIYGDADATVNFRLDRAT